MNFIQVGMLGALGALAIPILIHLLFRRQARPIDLGTLQFLKIVVRDNAKRRRLKRYMLLALRMAGVALIAFLFARPYLLAEEPVDGRRLVVVLVDRSASMGLTGGTRPIDGAAAELRRIVARAGGGTQLEVATFDRGVHPLKDGANARFEPSASGTDYATAMAWARDLCVRSRAGKKELHILTDLQRSGLNGGEPVKIPGDVDVHLVDLGRAFPKNVGVVGVMTSPENPRPKDDAIVTASVRNASPMPAAKVPVRLVLKSEGATPIDVTKTIDLDGGSTATVEFPLKGLTEGLWTGTVEATTGDGLAFDDRRYLALAVAPASPVLIVDGEAAANPFESETYFLKAALRLAPEGETYAKAPFDPTTVEADSALPDLSRTRAVVLANAGNLPADDAKTLAAYVAGGGGLVVFTGDRVTAESTATLASAGLGVGKVAGPVAAADRPWRLESWEAKHPLFRPFADPEHGDLRRPAFTSITKIVPDPDSRVLARFRGGDPALIERAVGRGRVLWFASACDRSWGDWPRGRLYVPMVHQIVSHAMGLSDGGRVRGEVASGDRRPGLVEANGLVTVVNADAYETDVARCTPKQFADRFGFKLPGPKAPTVAADGGRRRTDERLPGDELWPWLALALVGVLMAEHFLANRTAA